MSIIRHFPQSFSKGVIPYTPVVEVKCIHSCKQQKQSSNDIKNKQNNINDYNDNQYPNLLFISGQIPINNATLELTSDKIQQQTHQVMKNLSYALKYAGSSFDSILKTTILLTDMANFAAVNTIYGSYFKESQYPARICYAVKSLPKNSLIQIQAIALRQSRQQGSQPQKRVKLDKQTQ